MKFRAQCHPVIELMVAIPKMEKYVSGYLILYLPEVEKFAIIGLQTLRFVIIDS
jgi:hypothetical protein